MPRPAYSWEKIEPSSKKRSLRRWFIFVPLLLMGLGVLVAGLFALSVRYEFSELAKQFDLTGLEKMESASLVYSRDGTMVGKFFIQNRNPVNYSQLSKFLVEAVVATEDQKFWSHDGVDYQGIARAAVANYTAGRIRQGASTVTQQLARNSFDLKERTYRRKLLEISLAHRIEESFSKEKIMELYLNRVYFGSGLYGADAAARGYFGLSAADISAGQAATLAGLLKAPNGLSPWTNPKASQASRDSVLRQMYGMGALSYAEYEAAVDQPLLVQERFDPIKQSYAMDYVRQQAIASLGYERAMNGGFRIHTTLDLKMQREAEKALQRRLVAVERRPGYSNETYAEFLERFETNKPQIGQSNKVPPKYLQGAVLALNNQTGGILVMVGGRQFRHSEYNRSVQGLRPVGTAFGPILYAAAFEKGIFPGDLVQDWALDNRLVGFGGSAGILGEWGVERADNEYEGDITARSALVHGKNAAVVRVGFRTGLKALGKVVKDAGIGSALRPYANAYLGSSEQTLEETTLAYTMFPGGGTRPARTHIISRIETVYETKLERERVISDATAWQVHSLLTESLQRGTAEKAVTEYGLAVAGAAGKTGTAYNFTDAWFLGYDSAVTCGVWVGFDRPQQIFRGAFGKDLALPVWVDVMNASRNNFPSTPLRAPLTVEEVQICRLSGERGTDQCQEMIGTADGGSSAQSTLYNEYARLGFAPKSECSVHAGGMKSFFKQFAQAEWPRAATALDLSKVRPIAVSSAPVVGQADPYNSVSPATMASELGNIPVAKPNLVNLPSNSGGKRGGGLPAMEVRRAEVAGVAAALPTEPPSLELAKPPPIRF